MVSARRSIPSRLPRVAMRLKWDGEAMALCLSPPKRKPRAQCTRANFPHLEM